MRSRESGLVIDEQLEEVEDAGDPGHLDDPSPNADQTQVSEEGAGTSGNFGWQTHFGNYLIQSQRNFNDVGNFECQFGNFNDLSSPNSVGDDNIRSLLIKGNQEQSGQPTMDQSPGNAKSSEVSFVCKSCNLSLESLENLNDHYASQHKIQRKLENQCSICSIVLPSRGEMINHKRQQHPQVWMRNQCEYCNKAFASKLILNQHRNVVHFNIKKYGCGKCNLRFGQKMQLNRHQCATPPPR